MNADVGAQTMKTTIEKTNAQYSTVNALTDNGILVVFHAPNLRDFQIGDELEIDLTKLDQSQNIKNQTRRTALYVRIQSNDVHDLRLPAGHETSRFPSVQRRRGEE